MKLRNKKTGEIVEITMPIKGSDGWRISANSLDELNEEWEDYEEPKEYWFIDFNGEIKEFEVLGYEWQGWMQEIGNYFETKEEARKAVEKLKVWKRLKDRGFKRVFSLELRDALCGGKTVEFKLLIDDKDLIEDIKLLFGGEE